LKFRTEIKPSQYPFDIGYGEKALFMGSCFTENLGTRLKNDGFDVDINPFGVLYNPISIANSLNLIANPISFSEKNLVFDNELYHSFLHHGSFSSDNSSATLDSMNTGLFQAHIFFKEVRYIFITLGTAWVYRHVQTQEIVSNCHKFPSKFFEYYRLSVDEIVKAYQPLIANLQSQNQNVKIIFTVSPIRHWKDGAHENQLSKSTLLLAIEQIQSNHSDVYYYPAYELLMDDLRDYRFYESDLLHLNSLAIDYIFEHFSNSMISSKTSEILKQYRALQNDVLHRPFNPNTAKHLAFIERTNANIINFTKKYPEVILHFNRP